MKHLALLIALLALALPAWATHTPYDKHTLLIKFKTTDDETINTVAKTLGAAKVQRLFPPTPQNHSMSHWYRVTLEPTLDSAQARVSFAQHPDVEHAELNYQLQTASEPPNDPLFPQQWSLHEPSTNPDTPTDTKQVRDGLDFTDNGKPVTVAVIDTGVDYTHPDLRAHMWRNPDEIPNNNQDDDQNGCVDDIYGCATTAQLHDALGFYPGFNDHTYDTWGIYPDHNGHGTHVAGIVAAVANNGIGIAGLAQNARIMSVSFLSNFIALKLADAAAALRYAAGEGAQIVVNSYTNEHYSALMKEAIVDAGQQGVLFVTAAGNYGRDLNRDCRVYPACYNLPNMLVVGARGVDGERWEASDYGDRVVDLDAPGVDILSTVPIGQPSKIRKYWDPSGYRVLSGTSQAAPYAAADRIKQGR